MEGITILSLVIKTLIRLKIFKCYHAIRSDSRYWKYGYKISWS